MVMWNPNPNALDTQANAFEFDSLGTNHMECHSIMHFRPSLRLEGGKERKSASLDCAPSTGPNQATLNRISGQRDGQVAAESEWLAGRGTGRPKVWRQVPNSTNRLLRRQDRNEVR